MRAHGKLLLSIHPGVNTVTGKAGKAIKAGTQAGAIAITPDGRTAYVSCEGSNPPVVVPIRTATNTAGKAINAGPFPGSIAITPNCKNAYVVNEVISAIFIRCSHARNG